MLMPRAALMAVCVGVLLGVLVADTSFGILCVAVGVAVLLHWGVAVAAGSCLLL